MFVVYELFIYVLHVIYTFRTLLCIFETFVDVKLQLKFTSLSLYCSRVSIVDFVSYFSCEVVGIETLFFTISRKKNNLYT